jgi:hypothetical protein
MIETVVTMISSPESVFLTAQETLISFPLFPIVWAAHCVIQARIF